MTEKTKEVKAKADRLVELTAQKERVQAEMEEIKAWFENLAVNDLKDTKKKDRGILGQRVMPGWWWETVKRSSQFPWRWSNGF